MTVLRVNTEIMAASASKIENAIDDIGNVLNLLNNDVNAMLDAWQGEAADAHRDMHVRFQKDASVIRNSLSEMCSSLLRTHSIYVAQETEQHGDQVAMSSQILT